MKKTLAVLLMVFCACLNATAREYSSRLPVESAGTHQNATADRAFIINQKTIWHGFPKAESSAGNMTTAGTLVAPSNLSVSGINGNASLQWVDNNQLTTKYTWVAMGSSSTAGNTGPTTVAMRYVEQVKKAIAPWFNSFTMQNIGVGGATSYNLMPTGFIPPDGREAPLTNYNITKALSYAGKKMITVFLPTNDVYEGISNPEYINNLLAMKAACPADVLFVVITTTPRNFSDLARRAQIRDATTLIRQNFGIYIVDVYDDFATDDLKLEPQFDYGDGFHINDAGHTYLANRISTTVGQLIADQLGQPGFIHEEGFWVYRSVNGGAFTKLGEAPANATSFTDNTVESGKTYAYQVRAFANTVTSNPSNTASLTNQSPVANAGADQTITLPTNTVILYGTGEDPDGTIAAYSWSQSSGPAIASFSSKTVAQPTVSALKAGSYVFSLTVTDNQAARHADQVTVKVQADPTTPGATAYHINSGGAQVSTNLGVFAADTYFSPATGYLYATKAGISGTTHDVLYQTARGSEKTNSSFAYNLPVSNGNYTVVLHFAELSFSGIGQRLFDVTMEGTKVLDNYDIIKKTGSRYLATTETFSVTVSDGMLNLLFSSRSADGGLNRPLISAIEVLTATTPYARILAAVNQPQLENAPTVYPNPAQYELFVAFITDAPGSCYLQVLDLTGRILEEQQVVAIAGNNIWILELRKPSISAGSYLLKVKTATGESKIVRFSR